MKQHMTFFWVLFVTSLFGPYLVGGLRTDHLMIYGTAGLASIFLMWRWGRVKIPPPLLNAVLAWSVLVALAMIGPEFDHRGLNSWSTGL